MYRYEMGFNEEEIGLDKKMTESMKESPVFEIQK
jgi:hypothetical protein